MDLVAEYGRGLPVFSDMRTGISSLPENHSPADSAAMSHVVSGYRSSWNISDWKRADGK